MITGDEAQADTLRQGAAAAMSRRYGPVVIFLLVLGIFAWAVALHRVGAR